MKAWKIGQVVASQKTPASGEKLTQEEQVLFQG
jgi:hypothetical protein